MHSSHRITAHQHSIQATHTGSVALDTDTAASMTAESTWPTELGDLELDMCPGFEGWRLCCLNFIEPDDVFCKRCRELERAYEADAEALLEEERRRQAGIYTDEEKEILKESLNEDERRAFDQACSLAEFLEGLKALLRSQVDFLLAERMDRFDLIDRASAVLVWRNRRFVTIRELVDECGAHRVGGLIYEVWARETVERVCAVIGELHPTPARAMMLYAKHAGFDPAKDGGAFDAYMDAQLALLGNP